MSELEFTDFLLSIEDLPARARGLDEDATSDVLGGFGRSSKLRGRRRRRLKKSWFRRKSKKWTGKRVSGFKRGKKRKKKTRRSRRKSYAAKASFHSRMAARYRRLAAG